MNDLQRCYRCRLDLSPEMLYVHRALGHRLLQCQVCRIPLIRPGVSRRVTTPNQFCSPSCMLEAERRGLCTACSREPDASFVRGRCLDCRSARSKVIREVRGVTEAIAAMRRARYVPRPYRRSRGSID